MSEALVLADDTLTRMRRKLGDNHPQALGCAVGLANCRGDSGEYELAEALLCETIVLLRDGLGREHPDILVCEANLAITWHEAGRTKDADELLTTIMDSLSPIVGPQHPDIRLLRDWCRIDLDLEALPI